MGGPLRREGDEDKKEVACKGLIRGRAELSKRMGGKQILLRETKGV